MQKRRCFILLVWLCCFLLDHYVGIGPEVGPDVHYSFIGALIAGVASLASGIAASASANNKRRKAEGELERKKRELREWRDSELNTNYLDRADSRTMMRRVFEYNKEAQKAMNTDAVKRGMTDEAKVAQAAKLNENYADAVSQIAAAGARHKDQVQQQYLGETRNLDNLKIQNLMDTSGADNLVQGITGAVGGIGTALAGTGTGAVAKVGTGTQPGTAISPRLQSMAQNGVGIPKNYKIKL